MIACENCGSILDPKWKFCIYCGRPVVVAAFPRAVSHPAPVPATAFAPPPAFAPPASPAFAPAAVFAPPSAPGAAAAPAPVPSAIATAPQRLEAQYEPSDEEIPGAIREAEHAGKRKFRFDWQLALGITLALGGIAMIVYLVVVLVVPHA